ncbi:hypothetical protein PHYPSEUDO_010437 [Phytophthora pseudosyringae]|uniref:RxLR effector protein n=1 Tax=Phytophthora pseudosyringae TaxID=221518 RepID=A0A8T1VA63_9STRA|nr:hypothetical protein PHYPSEUDO_010437 [Phytophthora pseudosyringae]
MRVCYALIAVAAILAQREAVADSKQNQLVADIAAPSLDAAQIATSSKRYLRLFEVEKQLPKVIKRQQVITVDQLLNTKHLDEILDPKRADALLAKKNLGGWLDKSTLDAVLRGDFAQKKEMFKAWRASGRTSRMVTRLIKKSDPSIEKKYRVVYTMYAGYLKMVYKQENNAKRLAAAAAAGN